PHSEWNPTGRVVRLAAGVGLWDRAAGHYLLPQQTADSTHPGGAGQAAAPAAFFNVAFRGDEPMPTIKDVFNTAISPSWWRDKEQGQQLAAGDITNLHADVDFDKLAAGTDDDSGVPQTGPMDRILASHFETGQGADFGVACFTASTNCPGPYQGQLQPEARGPDGGYDGYAAVDVFEVWADAARHYRLDPEWTVATGYSMGGFGTFRLASLYPDLFALAQPTVGAADDDNLVASLRNVPF